MVGTGHLVAVVDGATTAAGEVGAAVGPAPAVLVLSSESRGCGAAVRAKAGLGAKVGASVGAGVGGAVYDRMMVMPGGPLVALGDGAAAVGATVAVAAGRAASPNRVRVRCWGME